MSFVLAKLDSSIEQIFTNHVNQDVPHYYWFIFDWKLNRDLTEIWLALKHDKIHGMMLIYDKHVVQIRGSKSAADALIDNFGSKLLEKFQYTVEMEHGLVVHRRFRVLKEYELLLMALKKGQERLTPTDNVVRLAAERSSEIAELMRSTNPEFWGDAKAEKIAASMNRNLWLGVIVDDKLVSVGNTLITDFISNIGIVATHESYRNRGYATSVVSALVKEILRTNDTALIHTQKHNTPARRVYEKVGFKTYKNYLHGFAEI